jgi:hypothetical protein
MNMKPPRVFGSRILFFAAALIAAGISAQEPTKFQIKGVRVGMKREEVASKLTNMVTDPKLSEKAIGVEVTKATDDSPPSELVLTFLDGTLIRIVGNYTDTEIERIGGSEVILAKMRDRLGLCTTEMHHTPPIGNGFVVHAGSWIFKDPALYFSFATESNSGVISSNILAVDSNGWAVVGTRKKKSANAGF